MAGRATSRSDLDRLVVPQTGLDVQNFLSGLPARPRQLPDHVLLGRGAHCWSGSE